MFGYIICGVLLGPSGLNSIKVRTKLNYFSISLTEYKRNVLEDKKVLNLN